MRCCRPGWASYCARTVRFSIAIGAGWLLLSATIAKGILVDGIPDGLNLDVPYELVSMPIVSSGLQMVTGSGPVTVTPGGPQNLSPPFTIQINPGPTLGSPAYAGHLAAFQRAADTWELYINDPITVIIDADMVNLGNPNIIGQANSVTLQTAFGTMRNQMVVDADDEVDDTIVASLPVGASYFVPGGFGLSGFAWGTKANLKALNFVGLPGGADATIQFITQFPFDTDNSVGGGGVSPGMMDLETVAAHEIGHALGFVSATDQSDFYVSQGQTANLSPYTLDMFRFQNGGANEPATVPDFATFPRSLVPRGDTITDEFANEWRMSTGFSTGDGRQASHWKDDAFVTHIGVMDPTLSTGVAFPIELSDLRALDLIGYEIVPEPSTLLLAVFAAVGIGVGRRKRLTA